MDLTPYLESLRSDLSAAAAPGGPDTTRAAELLGTALEAAARLALLQALSDAAAEITTRLQGTVVDVRLRGREAELVVTPPTADPAPAPQLDGGDLARVTLRLPESLKTYADRAAAAEGVSVNAWLVRAVAAAASRPAPPTGRDLPGKRFTGFAQA